MTLSSAFFDMTYCLLSSLVTCPIFMSISLLVLELRQFSFIIWKSELCLSRFCPISEDWGKLKKENLAWMSLVKRYWKLQNPRGTAFTVSGLLREEGRRNTPTPPRIGLRFAYMMYYLILHFLKLHCFDTTILDAALYSVDCCTLQYCSI